VTAQNSNRNVTSLTDIYIAKLLQQFWCRCHFCTATGVSNTRPAGRCGLRRHYMKHASLKPNTHRRHRRQCDATVELSCVGGVYWALAYCTNRNLPTDISYSSGA